MSAAPNLKAPQHLRIEQGLNRGLPQADPEKLVLLKIRITSEDDLSLMRKCDTKTLAEIQAATIASIKDLLGQSLLVKVDFYKGSLILIVTAQYGFRTAESSSLFGWSKRTLHVRTQPR